MNESAATLHETRIETSYTRNGSRWLAFCSCGWFSPVDRVSPDGAGKDRDEHLASVSPTKHGGATVEGV